MKTTTRLQIGYLLPRILALLLILDLFLRVCPLNWLAFRALESAQRRLPTCIGPFEPNARFQSDNTYGDLASLGNLPAMRQYRSVTFTTDAMGFHNPPHLAGVPDVLLVGDSFAMSTEVPEDRTFAAQLSRRLGRPVYNAAEDEALLLAPLRAVAQRLGMRRGYVVYEFLERHLTEPPPLRTATGKRGLKSKIPEALGPVRWDKWRLPVWHAIEFSPLEALATKLNKSLCDDWLLPNRYAGNVLVRRLNNDDTLLFLPRDVSDTAVTAAQFQRWADYFTWLSAELQKEHLTLVVMLVPNKYTVYQPWFAPAEKELPGAQNLRHFSRQLRAARLPTVQLIDRYRLETAENLVRHRLLYWKDDTHWNAFGMAVAAEAAAQVLAETNAAPDPAPGLAVASAALARVP